MILTPSFFHSYVQLNAASHIILPRAISNRRAVINVQNSDERCFAYAIMSKVLYDRHEDHIERSTKYTAQIWSLFDFSGIHYPTPFKDIKIFERKNSASVNIYGLEQNARDKTYVYPIRISENFIREKHFDLLYIQKEDTSGEIRGHYCLITDLARLVHSQITSNTGVIFICRRCLTHFGSQDLMDTHEVLCASQEPVRYKMPEGEGRETCKFKNYRFQQHIPYIVYADFECALTRFVTIARDPDLNESYTEKKHKHVPTSWCYYIVCSNEGDNTDYQLVVYRGPNAIRKFWDILNQDLIRISDIYENIIPINHEEIIEFRRTNINNVFCHICNHRPTVNILDNMVVDHCHLTGRIRGWACNTCNINYKSPDFVPIVFHNGSSYDFRLIISEVYSEPANETTNGPIRRRRRSRNHPHQRSRRVRARNEFVSDEVEVSNSDGEDDDENDLERLHYRVEGDSVENNLNERRNDIRRNGGIQVIAQNAENFISFEVAITNTLNARFIDSYRFLQSSLAELAKNLTDDQMHHTRRFFQDNLFTLARRKGVFPYEYITSLVDYDVTELPTIEEFYSSLNDEGISESDYEHATRVWNAFNCQNLGDYSDTYQKIDVVILADVFENFRKLGERVYKLDPAWVYSAPGLAWNAMLKLTGVEVELFTDIEKYLFCESGIRGGYVCASKRYAKVNNRNLPNFNPNEEESHLLYIDANNLYGHAMSRPLPLNNFEWMEQGEIENLSVLSILENSDTGYILEVDLEYPPELHDEHNDLPYCPEQLRTTTVKNAPKKLIATLHNKKNYIVHHRYLQSALQNGLRLIRIHRGLRFHQRKWLEPYIRMNNEWRQMATDKFSKDFFKLMNNSVFGKFIESVRKHRDFIVNDSLTEIQRLIRKPNFKNRVILNERTNLCLIEMGKTSICLDKFIQAGTSILDLSKAHMYEFHHQIIKREIFPDDRISLMYMDTDSLTYHIHTRSLTERLLPHKRHFDFSNYPEGHPLYDVSNKAVLGKMKDEVEGLTMSEYCALKAKMYSFIVGNRESKKAKGEKKSVVSKTLTFHDYVNCLRNGVDTYRTMRGIRSYGHQLYTIEQKKIALSNFDDKRCILEDGIHTLAWGHRDIPHDEDLIYLLNHPDNAENDAPAAT